MELLPGMHVQTVFENFKMNATIVETVGKFSIDLIGKYI